MPDASLLDIVEGGGKSVKENRCNSSVGKYAEDLCVCGVTPELAQFDNRVGSNAILTSGVTFCGVRGRAKVAAGRSVTSRFAVDIRPVEGPFKREPGRVWGISPPTHRRTGR